MNFKKGVINKFFHSKKIFRIIIVIRGIYSVLQFILGLLILLLNKSFITRILTHLVSGELLRDPKDYFANILVKFSTNLSLSTKEFIALYLLVHGIINIILIYGLLKEKNWSYPTALGFFIFFLMFEIYRFLARANITIFVLIILDIIIIFIIANKYLKIIKKR